MWCVQAPYDIQVTGPSYLSLLDLSNAERLGNVTNGTLHLRVSQTYQTLEPNYSNSVNVTLVLSTSSQVSTCQQPWQSPKLVDAWIAQARLGWPMVGHSRPLWLSTDISATRCLPEASSLHHDEPWCSVVSASRSYGPYLDWRV